MIYIVKGDEEYFIKEKLKELKKEDAEIVEFDGSSKTFSISNMLEACQSNSLFAPYTVVLVKDPYFLIKKEDNINDLMDYINNPLYECDLIFYTYTNAFNERLKVYKDICKNADVINCNGYVGKDFNQYALNIINHSNLNLNNEAKNLLIQYVNNNASLLNRNIEILKIYPDKIDEDVINALCSESDEMNVFDLINALTSKNISKSISLSRKMLANNDSIIPLISLLSGQYRFLYYVAYLEKQGNSLYDIASITGSKEYRIKVALNTLRSLSMKEILIQLKRLHELDIKVKSVYNINEKERFEYFILNLMNNNE